MRRSWLLYLLVFTMTFVMGLTVWQSARYMDVERQIRYLEADQETLVENNERLIADIAALTSSEYVESVAINDLGLTKIQPENVLQVWIEGRD